MICRISNPAVSALAALLVGSSLVSALPFSNGSTTPGKRGLCYNNAAWSLLFGTESDTQLTWQYNWDSTDPGSNPDLEFVPMLWGTQDDHTAQWFANANASIAAGSTHLLAFNEPDLASQSNLLPQDAVDAYMKYMQPYAGIVKLGGPAISAAGVDWLTQFTNLCSECTIDFQPVHWYDSATNYPYFTSYLQQVYDILPSDRHIWLTEFEGSGSQDEQITFLETVMPWMDSQDFIDRYSWYGVFDQNLVSADSNGNEQENPLGQVFDTYYSYNTTMP
ncbi:MAG: hypothetical protein M1818_001617 [Claussenomyces sp. TS43310]|nr:MAG: hypothetical protein M1818_001617 [Claussenomyces sp. TS43310]